MTMTIRYKLALLASAAIVTALFLQGTAQQQNVDQDSAVRIRALLRELQNTKAPEKRWLLIVQAVSMFEQKTDVPAASALIEELVDAMEKTTDDKPDPRLDAVITVHTVIEMVPPARRNFVVSLLPMLEGPRSDKVVESARSHIIDYYASGEDHRIDSWIGQYLKKGELPPKGLLDKMFEKDPEMALRKLWQINERYCGTQLSEKSKDYLSLAMYSVRNAVELFWYVYDCEYKTEAVAKELQRLFESEKLRVRRVFTDSWEACSEWYVRRYLVHYVRKYPNIFLTPELMKLMRQEKHPAIKPLVEELEEIYARFFPSG
jgi:hypothetical protein